MIHRYCFDVYILIKKKIGVGTPFYKIFVIIKSHHPRKRCSYMYQLATITVKKICIKPCHYTQTNEKNPFHRTTDVAFQEGR